MNNSNSDASATIGAREFHQKTGVTNMLRKAENSFRDRFIDTRINRVKKEYVEPRNCPLCQRSENVAVFVKNGFEHCHCDCGMVYVNEVLKEEYINIIYDNNEFEGETHKSFRTEPRKSFIEAIYDEGYTLMQQGEVRVGGVLFDVGCSSGLFLESIQKKGFKVSGIEPSRFAVEIAQNIGLDVRLGYFGKETLPRESTDVITLWDVLEHCERPEEILKDAFDALSPGGMIFLQVPNVMGLAPRILKEDCNMFTGFGHINLFGPTTLSAIVKQVGFGQVQMQSVISEISVINNYLNYYDPYLGPSDGKGNVLGVLDAETIKKNLWGYKLQLIAKKSS